MEEKNNPLNEKPDSNSMTEHDRHISDGLEPSDDDKPSALSYIILLIVAIVLIVIVYLVAVWMQPPTQPEPEPAPQEEPLGDVSSLERELNEDSKALSDVDSELDEIDQEFE